MLRHHQIPPTVVGVGEQLRTDVLLLGHIVGAEHIDVINPGVVAVSAHVHEGHFQAGFAATSPVGRQFDAVVGPLNAATRVVPKPRVAAVHRQFSAISRPEYGPLAGTAGTPPNFQAIDV